MCALDMRGAADRPLSSFSIKENIRPSVGLLGQKDLKRRSEKTFSFSMFVGDTTQGWWKLDYQKMIVVQWQEFLPILGKPAAQNMVLHHYLWFVACFQEIYLMDILKICICRAYTATFANIVF
jgi:hypothetical protein